jgi:hypothetical protein
MPCGRHWGALPLAPGRCAAWRAVLLGQTGPAVQQGRESRRPRRPVARWSGWHQAGWVVTRPRHLCHPVGVPLHDDCPDVTVDARAPTGAVRQPRLRAVRGGQVRRSSAPAAGRTAGPGPVPRRGRVGPGRRRGRHPIDRRARRATAASLDGSARGVHGSRPDARPPALPSGRSSPRGSAPRPGAGRWPSTTSGSGRACGA